MANPYKGEVELSRYVVRFTANALCELEDVFGASINQVATKLANPDTMRVKDIMLVLQAGLRNRQPNITLEDVDELITEVGLVAAMGAVGKAFNLTLVKESKEDPSQPGSGPVPNGKGEAVMTVEPDGIGLNS